MTGFDAAGVSPLLDELFDHAERNIKSTCHLIAGHVATVISLEDAFA
jgi:hypothetical protein